MGKNDELPAEATFVPPSTDLRFPEYFSDPVNRLTFNPFRRSNSISANPPLNILDQAPDDSLPALDIADKWSSGTRSVSSSGRHSEEIADIWTSGSGSGSPTPVPAFGDDDTHLGENVKKILQVADVWEDCEDDDVDVADNWTSGSEAGHGMPEAKAKEIHLANEDGSDPAPLPGHDSSGNFDVQDPNGILSLADLWMGDEEIDQEHSGDELSGDVSYPVASGGLDIANQWSDTEENPPNEGDWSYGPEHFSFLRDEMFESDDDNF
jgi:hypothetical protein